MLCAVREARRGGRGVTLDLPYSLESRRGSTSRLVPALFGSFRLLIGLLLFEGLSDGLEVEGHRVALRDVLTSAFSESRIALDQLGRDVLEVLVIRGLLALRPELRAELIQRETQSLTRDRIGGRPRAASAAHAHLVLIDVLIDEELGLLLIVGALVDEILDRGGLVVTDVLRVNLIELRSFAL